MENTETQAGAEEPTAPQRPSEALSKEAAMDLWEREKEERGIEGKPDLSHVTAGLYRCLELSQKRDRRKLKRAVQSWADQCGLNVGERTIRNWINGKWTEEAAAVAVLGARAAILEGNFVLRGSTISRVPTGPLNPLGPLPWDVATIQKVTHDESYRVAFELCVFGEMEGAEHEALVLNTFSKVCDLSDEQLLALNAFLDAFSPDSKADGPEMQASEIVEDLYLVLQELAEWAIQVDEANGEGSCLNQPPNHYA